MDNDIGEVVRNMSDEALMRYRKDICKFIAIEGHKMSEKERVEAGVVFAMAGFEAMRRGVLEPGPRIWGLRHELIEQSLGD